MRRVSIATIAVLIVITFVIILISFYHQQRPASGKIVVTFWNQFTEGGPGHAMRQLVAEFNETHPGIYVDTADTPVVDRKLLAPIAGNVPPDVVLFDRHRVAAFAARNAFTPLNDFIEQAGIKPEQYFEPCWMESQYDGTMYAMPFNTDVRVLFYNKKLFREAGLDPEKPPRIWEELREYSKILTKKNDRGQYTQVGYVPLPGWGNTWLFLFGWQKGGEFMSDDGRTVTVNDPKIVEALQWVVDFVDWYGYDKLVALASGFGARENTPFIRGKIAMQGDEQYLMRLLKEYNPELEYGVAPHPWPAGGEHVTWSGGFSLIIPTGAKHPKEAWEFVRWMTDTHAQFIYGKASDQMPAKIEAARDPYFLNDPRMRVFLDEMEYSRYRPVTSVGSKLWDEVARAVDLAILHKKTPQQALDDAAKNTQKELDEFLSIDELPVVNWSYVTYILIGLICAGVAVFVIYVLKTTRKKSHDRKEFLKGMAFISPWLIGLFVFIAGPVLLSLVYSFSHYEVLRPARWVGLDNYKTLFGTDPLFWKALYNTVYYTIFAVPLGLVTALVLAMLLDQKVRGITLFRTIFYLPAIVPLVASAVLWIWIFNPDHGLFNYILDVVFQIKQGPLWLNHEFWSKPALIIMSVWGVGGTMLIYLAGLQGIPPHLYEVAEIDGAGAIRKFFHVTLPMLTPTIFFTMVMGIIASFQVFTQVYVITLGGSAASTAGPADSLLFYVLYIFNTAFMYLRMGYASAMAWILFAIILILTIFQIKIAPRWVYYEGETTR